MTETIETTYLAKLTLETNQRLRPEKGIETTKGLSFFQTGTYCVRRCEIEYRITIISMIIMTSVIQS